MRAWRILIIVMLCVFAPWCAAQAAAGPDSEAPVDRREQVRQLLASPDVKALIAALNDPATRDALVTEPGEPVENPTLLVGRRLGAQLSGMRAHIVQFIHDLPAIPAEVGRAFHNLKAALPGNEALHAVLGLTVLLCVGALAELAAITAARGWRLRIRHVMQDTVTHRAWIVVQRLAYGMMLLASWAAGTLGGFMLFSWEPGVDALLLGYLSAALLVGVSLVVTRFALAPAAPQFRLLPMPTAAAWFWHLWLAILTAIGAFGWQTVAVLRAFGAAPAAADALSYLVGLLVVLCGLAAAWFADHRARQQPHRAGVSRGLAIFISVYPPLVWLAFVAGAGPLGWMMIAAAAGPMAVYFIHHTIRGVERGLEDDTSTPASAWTILVERVLQGIVIFAAVSAVLRFWGVGLDMLSARDTPGSRLIFGTIEAMLVLYAAELLWQVVRSVIDARLHRIETADATQAEEAELRHRARLRTLLPVLRSFILITIAAVGMMTALAALGLQIGPLLAGAGVVGVAIGFGAQALVRDVISGVFFLLDDAFRVGEYIETGAIRGSVASFSLRSIKLRDFKGQLHTLPFGEVRTVTNYSREWVSEELQIGVRHDADLDAVGRAIQDVSDALMQDPAVAASIIEPLRSIGVVAISDYAMRIGVIVKTRPGEQVAVRAKAYQLIQRIFLAHGIRLASPTLLIEDRAAASAGLAGAGFTAAPAAAT